MKPANTSNPAPRRDTIKSHLVAEERHDPYRTRGKPAEPTVCRQCMAVFQGGRWCWVDGALPGAHWDLCPACHRINDKYPAGELTLAGDFLAAQGREIVRLARNIEALERHEHPLQRIMDVAEHGDSITITTTDIHLPRRIGHAIEKAYKGELATHYDEAGHFVRITWRRDDRATAS